MLAHCLGFCILMVDWLQTYYPAQYLLSEPQEQTQYVHKNGFCKHNCRSTLDDFTANTWKKVKPNDITLTGNVFFQSCLPFGLSVIHDWSSSSTLKLSLGLSARSCCNVEVSWTGFNMILLSLIEISNLLPICRSNIWSIFLGMLMILAPPDCLSDSDDIVAPVLTSLYKSIT